MANDPRISSATKIKVRRAAEELGYVGNLAARMLRGGSSNLIGLIIPDVRNDFYAAVAQSVSECCDREGFRVVLSITSDDRDAESRHIRDLADAAVAGIIIVPTMQPRRETVSILQTIPHVQLLRKVPAFGAAWFGIDDETALKFATSYLLDLGHRRIAYIGGSEKLSTGAARVAGVRRAMLKAGQDLSLLSTHLGAPTATAGEAAIEHMLGLKDRPTAVVTGSVHVTLGVLRALKERKINVPDEFSLVGFGDPDWYEWWGPGVTTVQPPIRSLAVGCAHWFLDQLRNPGSAAEDRDHQAVLSSKLVIRGSTRRL
jgi:LacI family transcriptional regulator